MENPLNSAKDAAHRLLRAWLGNGKPRRRKKICVFKPDGIGDFVVSSEAIRKLVAQHGAEAVSLIVSHHVLSLVKQLFPEVETLAIVPGHAGWAEKMLGLRGLKSVIQGRSFEEVICLRHYRTAYEEDILRALNARRVTLLTNQSRIKRGVGPPDAPDNFFYVEPWQPAPEEGRSELPREWYFHAAVLSTSFGRIVRADSMQPNWDAYRTTRERLHPFMLIAPLAGGRIRDLPQNLVEAAALKASEHGLNSMMLTGSREQAERLKCYAEKLSIALPACSVEVFHPADLPAFVRLISKARIVLTAESSAAHLATALDKPTLAFIGGGHYGWFAPWTRSSKQLWLTQNLPCFDCNWRCCYPRPLCLTDISLKRVQAAITELAKF